MPIRRSNPCHSRQTRVTFGARCITCRNKSCAAWTGIGMWRRSCWREAGKHKLAQTAWCHAVGNEGMPGSLLVAYCAAPPPIPSSRCAPPGCSSKRSPSRAVACFLGLACQPPPCAVGASRKFDFKIESQSPGKSSRGVSPPFGQARQGRAPASVLKLRTGPGQECPLALSWGRRARRSRIAYGPEVRPTTLSVGRAMCRRETMEAELRVRLRQDRKRFGYEGSARRCAAQVDG